MNTENLILTSEEIFYLGTLLQAKYIDYDYVKTMNDIQQKYNIYLDETKTSLMEKGILEEDFSGDVIIDEDVKKMILPLFFGDQEGQLDVSVRTDNGFIGQSRKFHFYEGNIITVDRAEKGYVFNKTDMVSLQSWIKVLFDPQLKEDGVTINADSVDRDKISCIIAVKNTTIGVKSATYMYFGMDEHIFIDSEDGIFKSMDYETLCNDVFQKLKGE